MHLSKNFTLSELTKSVIALQNGIRNEPNSDQMLSLTLLAGKILQPVRDHFGIPYSPTSGFRCEALEKAICWGGNDAKSSFAKWCARRAIMPNEETWPDYFAKKSHPSGEAGDLEVPGIPNLALAEWIRDNLEFDQLILEFWSPGDPGAGWVHCSFSAGNNRHEVLTIGPGGPLAGLGD